VTEGASYSSPPGVLEELIDPTSAFAGAGIEFNEKSLGIGFDDLLPGNRAEVYQRFPQRPRNFLSYRQARLWVVARSGDFGPIVRTRSSSRSGRIRTTSISTERGFRAPPRPLGSSPRTGSRRSASSSMPGSSCGSAPRRSFWSSRGHPGDPAVVVWSADSTYAVSLKDRGRAPNLAAVRELSLGVWNEGDAPTSGEIWVDELRLSDPVRDAGLAGSVDVVLDGGGALTSRLSVTSRGANFRQLRDEPTYQTDRSVDLRSTLALDRFMPSDWGVEVPVTLDVNRTTQAPRFLQGSDLRADRLGGLRETAANRTRVGVAFRRRTPAADPRVGFVVDGLSARAAYTRSNGSTVTTRHSSTGLDAGLAWVREPESREVGIVPGFAEGLVRALLPGFLEDDVVDARLRLTPERVSLGSSYLRQDDRVFRYERIIAFPGDQATLPTLVPREILESVADVRLRPLSPLTADLTVATERDLLPARDAVNDPRVQELLDRERARAIGTDLGWETGRSLRTRVGFTPQIVSWFRNDFDWSTTYRSDRSANVLSRTFVGADTTLALARDARGQRDWGVALALDPARLATSWLGAPTPTRRSTARGRGRR
jgi:cell surface protein SprA